MNGWQRKVILIFKLEFNGTIRDTRGYFEYYNGSKECRSAK